MLDFQKIGGEASNRTTKEEEGLMKLKEKTEYILKSSGQQWNMQLISTMRRHTLSKILYYNELYRKILNIPGVICEFGVHWGAATSLLLNLRGIYEPYNFSRKVYGFDTFSGFPEIDMKDGDFVSEGDYSAGDMHYGELAELLDVQESFSPINHIKKFQLIKGDATKTFPRWLEDNPSAIVSMAILDFDIYKPTKSVLANITERLTKGSLLVFDEVNCPHFPGETVALMETIGVNNLKLRRSVHQPWCAYAIWE